MPAKKSPRPTRSEKIITQTLTHFDAQGQAHMVDISQKPITRRVAIATGKICMNATTLQRIEQGDHKKGDVLGIARIAGIQAAKKTAGLIPLCHQIPLTRIAVEFTLLKKEKAVQCTATAETLAQTGVEMEALTAVQIALLTIYDMCKAVQKDMLITDIKLLKKTGGSHTDAPPSKQKKEKTI